LACGSCHRLGPQSPQPNQVVGRLHQGESPVHFPQAAQLHSLEQANRLHPAKGLFHALALPLTDGIAQVPRGAFVNDAGAVALFWATWGGMRISRIVPQHPLEESLGQLVVQQPVAVLAEYLLP
jgi:hypothetical protein